MLNSHNYSFNLAGQKEISERNDSSYDLHQYDNTGQLITSWGYDSIDNVINSEKFGFTYDTAWNMTKRTNNTTETTYTVNNLNQMTAIGGTTFTYDTNGNRLKRGTHEYTWDDENQLSVAIIPTTSKFEFSYDGRNRLRVRKEYFWSPTSLAWVLNKETRLIYDGMRAIEERNGSNTPQVKYTRGLDLSGTLEGAGGIGGMLARSASSATAFYFADSVGNISTIIDAGQNVVASYRYEPYGNVISSSGSLASDNSYKFSSKEVQSTLGFYYYGYRFYDPLTRRWLNKDPIEEEYDSNLYRFVYNSPPNYVDPDGLTG